MTVAKPTLPAFSPGHPVGYLVTQGDYNNDVLQQGARTQLLIEPVTAFPASPALTDWCFRSDLNAMYQCTNATGPVWTVIGKGPGPPTAVAGAGAGTTPTINVIAGSTDIEGRIQVVAGTTPTASAVIFTVTFHVTMLATPLSVMVIGGGQSNQALAQQPMAYQGGNSTTGWALTAGTPALSAGATYNFGYRVIQG